MNASPVLMGAIAASAVAAATLFGSDNSPMPTRAHALMGPIATGDDLKGLEARIAELEADVKDLKFPGRTTNSAFVFIKPHAVTPKTKALVKEMLAKSGIKVTGEGSLNAKTIDEEMLIDTHYGAIASKAVKKLPSELNVQPKKQEEFKQMFGISWEDALAQGKVYNAKAACEKLRINGAGLDKIWSGLSRGQNLIKFGGGFYCGEVEPGMFVINGFYMQMRSAFTTPPASIQYFTVEWPAASLSWEDFRGKVLGATDPKTAEGGSVRRAILEQWKGLGLKSEPNTGDNGVHASASPFEALAERMNWLKASAEDDEYGAALIDAGVSVDTIKEWTEDPQVPFDGRKQSLFDLLEDLDAKTCLEKATKILKQ